MSNAPLDNSKSSSDVPELHNGDFMTQREFHTIYERMPVSFRAELIGGTVFVSARAESTSPTASTIHTWAVATA